MRASSNRGITARRTVCAACVACAVGGTSSTASADPAIQESSSATDPLPGDESGRIDRIDDGDSSLRVLGRGILFVPRAVLEVAFAPVRVAIWADDRYHALERLHALFFNEAGTMGLYPTARLESGFGLTAGARFVHRDLLGAREHVALFAATGGRYRHAVSAALRTGHRLDPVRVELAGEYDQRPREAFYGIGNGDATAMSITPIDPTIDATAIEAHYRQELARAVAVVDLRLTGALHLRSSGALTELAFARSEDGSPIDELYAIDAMNGFSGARHAYVELELRWNGRRRASMWEPSAVPATGSYAGIYAGRVHRLDGGVDHWRWGVDLQRFVRIASGPRVIALRARAEAVTGSRSEVPFTELPQLGGASLRGYPSERFRDRVAGAGSIEYQWDLGPRLSASVFVDAGRVYHALPESIDALDVPAMRVGYGLGLQAFSGGSFWGRATIATSIDGGVFLDLAFDPVFDLDDRVERR